jgi:hypothetical protein
MAAKSEQQVDDFVRRFKLILIVLAAVVIVPVVGLIVYLNWRFNAFEDGLRYRAPDSAVDASELLDALPWEPVQGQTVYVPAYSHVYHEDGKPHLLTVTLSVRNADPDHELALTSVRYFDTKGKEIRSFLKKPLRLSPLASTEFLVERDDAAGGSGANFLVEWAAGEPVVPPVIESVMIGTSETQGISFARSGTVIREHSPHGPHSGE